MSKQTSPLPANKDLRHSLAPSLHQGRRSAAVLCERCRRKERRQRHRFPCSFLISATAALALQPDCASEPGAWKRSAGSAHNLCKCSGDQQEPQSSSSQEQNVSRTLGGSSGPCASFQPSLTECSGGSVPPSTHEMFPAFPMPATRVLEHSCSLPATILPSASWGGFHSCRCPEAQEILPEDVPPGSLDQNQQMSSPIISSPDVVHARFATNIA